MRLNKNSLDIAKIFLAFVQFVGDVERTAAALHLDPEVVRKLAEQEGWQGKIEKICLLSKSGKPGDWERAQHRALAFVQAHQLRRIIDGVLSELGDQTPEELVESLRVTTKGGSYMSAKFLSDLAAAMDKAHNLGYHALGDTLGERAEREGIDDNLNATALHLAVVGVLNNPKVKTVDVVAEVQAHQQEVVKSLTDKSAEPIEAEVVPTHTEDTESGIHPTQV